MATATIVTDLVTNLLTNCDSVTADGTWTGVTMAVGTLDPPPLEGTGRLDGIFKSTTDTSNDVFFAPTGGVNLTNQHIRWPLNTVLKSLMKTIALGGIEFILSDGTNTANYAVSGGDVYLGGWESLVLDVNATPTSGTAPTMSSITSIGLIFRLNAAAKNIDTAFFDYITFGDGFQSIYGGTSSDEITLADIAAQDVYYKIFEKIAGIYRARGELVFGDDISTNTTYFQDPGQVVFFDDLIVSSTLYKIKGVGNATGETHLDFSGIFFGSAGAKSIFDFTDTNVTEAIFDGTTIQNALDFLGSSIVSGDGTVFDTCGMLEPGLSTLTNYTIKNGNEAAALLLPDTNNIGAGTFISAGTGHAIQGFSVAGDYTLTNVTFTGYATSNGTTGNEAIYVTATTGTVTINISGGNTPYIRTAGATVVVVNAVSLIINIVDSAGSLVTETCEITVVKESDTSILYNVENLTTGTTTYGYDGALAGTAVYINVVNVGTYEIASPPLTLSASDGTISIQLVADRNYNNP